MNGKELDLSKIAEMISKTAEIARDKLENQSDKMYSVGEDMISSVGEGALAGAKSAAKNIDAAGDIITTKYQNVLSEINRIGKKKGDISSLFATITQIKRSDLNSFNALKDELKDMKAIFTDIGEVKGLDAILKQYGKTADKLRSIDFGFGSAFVARGRATGTKNLPHVDEVEKVKTSLADAAQQSRKTAEIIQSNNIKQIQSFQDLVNLLTEYKRLIGSIKDPKLPQLYEDIETVKANFEIEGSRIQQRNMAKEEIQAMYKRYQNERKAYDNGGSYVSNGQIYNVSSYTDLARSEEYLKVLIALYIRCGGAVDKLSKKVKQFAEDNDIVGVLRETEEEYRNIINETHKQNVQTVNNIHKIRESVGYKEDGSNTSLALGEVFESIHEGANIEEAADALSKILNITKEITTENEKITTSEKKVADTVKDASSDAEKRLNAQKNQTNIIKEQVKATEDLATAQEKVTNAQSKYMYHAGKFRDNGRKAESLGSLYPGRSTGFYGTGTYGVDLSHIKEISTGQYGKRPMSIIDTSSYNLYNATNDKVASSLHLFLQQLTDKIYGSKGSKRINALYSDFNKLFPDNTIITTYDEFKRVVEEIATYVSQNKGRYPQMYDLDSAPTMFMKKLGYEGINTLGTRHADTTYGTVIYDLKEESIICKEITDELQKQQILEGNIGEVIALNSKKMQEVADSSKSQSEAISAENAELERQQKIVNSSADIKKFQDEWDKAAKNHAPEDMGQRYGYLMEAISGDSPTMSAVDALNELIAKEQEWKAEQEAALEASRKRVEEVQAFCAAATEYQETIFSSESVKGEYAKALESISSGAMSATEGMETLKAAIEKYNTEIVEAVPSTQQQSEAEQGGVKAATEAAEAHRDVAAAMEQEAVAAEKLSSKQYNKMLNKKDISSLLEESGANSLISFVPKSKQKGFRQDLIDFANASLNDDNGTMSDIYLKLTGMIDKYGAGKTSTDKIYSEVWDYLKNTMITIPEDMEKSFASEFPDQWGQIKRRYGGNSKFKIKVEKGRLNVDQRYEELKRAFPGIFPDDIINDADQLRRIIEVADMGKAESKLPKFSTTPLSREDWGYIATVFSTMEEKAHALQILYNDVDNSASEMAVSSERTADAMERQAGASKNVSDNLGESAEDENQVFPIGEGLNDQKALEMVSTSKKPTLSATVFDGITSNDQLQTAFQSIIKDVEQQSMTLVKSDILDSIDRNGVGTLKFVSDDMNHILVQTWKMVEGQLTLASEKYTSIFKEPELFDVEDRKKVAQAQAQTLRTQFKGFANDPNYSGIISGVETAAGNITDAASFKKFNVELTAAREALKQLKAEMSSSKSLDPLAAAEKTINKLPFTLEKIQVEYKSLKEFDTGDIFGAEGVNVESLMDAVKTGMNGFNDSTRSISDRLASFKDILKAFDQLSVLMSTLRTKSKESKDSFTPILNTYKELTKLQEEQKKAEVSGATDEKKNLISDDIVAKTEKLKQLGVDINDIDKNTNLTTEQRNKLLKAQEESLARIKKIEVDSANSQAQKEKRQSLNYGKGAFNSETRKKDNLSAIYSSIEDNYGASAGLTDAMNAYLEKYKQFETARQKIADPTTDVTKADRDAFNKAKIEVESARKALEIYTTSYSKLEQAQNDGTLLGMDDAVDPSKLQNSTAALKAYGAEISNGKLNITGFNSTATEMYGTIDRGKGIIDKVTVALESSTGTLYAYKTATIEVGTAWEKFKGTLSRKVRELSAYVIGGSSIYQVINEVRKGITYVKEIDVALTELKKVTDETDETYNRFLQNASKTAGQIGSTVKEFTNATADFARLGYNIEQASELAKAASVYYNVGDDIADIGEASESIISTMHGFGIEASNAMNIVDKFNEVGNNFAISSSGIGQALLRSASAMAAAGNTIDESIGLITAANSVVQNPETVGTAMKTLSLRIRGAKVELEDAGEDVDGMANSVSELQKKLLALTGGKVNIMLDENTFKNTTEILREMSTVWDDMTDVNRAAALELLGGKRQANVLAAVIKNFDLVEGAIKTSSDAAGSAMAENEKYMTSIQGHIDQFNNSVQTMWMNLINSDVIKFIVDVGTGITTLIGKFGLLGTVITAVFGTKFIKAASAAWKFAKAATEAEYAKAEASAAATAAKEAEAAANAAESATETVDNKTTEENVKATTAKAAASDAAEKQKEAEAAANAAESATENVNNAENNMSKYSLGGIKKGWGKFKDTAVKFLGTTAGKITAVGAVIGGVAAAVKLTKNYIERKQAELAQEVQDLTNNYKETKTKIDANLKTLSESSDSAQYKTLSDEFSVLAAGVDKYGNNISLTSDQYERYKAICEQIIGIQPSLAEGYDSATQAIGNNANALKELIELQQEAARRSAEEYTSDENLKKVRKNTINKIKEAKKDLSSGISDLGASLLSGLKSQTGTDYGFTDTASDDVARTIMTQVLGFDEDNVDDILKEYFNKNTDISTAWNRWLSDYASQIKEHQQGIADLIGDVDKPNDFQAAISNYAIAADSISQAQKDFINTLLQVPMSQTEYSELRDSGKSFITEWIKNSDAFKIDEATSKSTILEMKKTIRGMVTELASNQDAQGILDSLFTIDTSKTNFEQYKKDVNEWLNMLFNSLGITDKDERNRIKIALGFDFEVKDEEGNTKQDQLVKDIARVTDDTEENIQEWLDSQPAAKVQALMQVDWSAESGLTKDEVLQKVASTIPKEATVSKTYSDLKNSISEVNDTLSQSSEIIMDNIKLTDEQGKALESLIGGEEDFADAIDTTNGYVVKNAALLKKLLATKKQESAQNIKISKSQARLQYYELYKKIRQLSQGNQQLAVEHKEEINALYAEMGAIEKTIAKYSMLEQQLLGAANAYEKFEEAKTIDEEKDYGSKASDMLSGLIQGLQSAKLGTESFQAAVSGMIPEDVYSGLSTVEEKVQAIANYLKNSNFSKYFTLEFEDDGTLQSAEMKLDNVKAFIEDAQEVGALTNKGDWKHFELDESIKTLDDFCNAMQITKEMAFAMFTEIDSYDAEWLNGDFGSMLDNLDLGLEGNIFMASKHITELDVALANGKISAEEYAAAMYGTGAAATESQKEIDGLAGQMQQYTQSARKSASEWKKASDEYEESKKKVEDLSKQIQQATKGADTSELEEKLKSAMEDMDKYAATMRDNEVSELIIKVAMDDVDNSIKLIEDKYSGIKDLIEQDNENGGFKIKTGINWESAPADEDTVNSYLALLNEKHTLEVMQGESLPTTLDVMQEMSDTLKTITEILAKHYGVNIETGEAEDSITGILNQLSQIKPKSVVITILGNISDTLKTWWGRLTGSGELNGSANDSTDAKRSKNNNIKVNGTAHATGSWGLKSSEHNALVGELGMETVVDPNTGKYYTVGDRGAEFVDLPRGAIIFNHKQTEALFKNGYVTSRGKMLANGNAHATGNTTIVPDFTTPTYYNGASNNNFWTDWNNSISNSADSISDASSAVEDAADDAKQTIDFIEYRLEEIENSITNMTNRVENFLDDTSQTKEKNSLYEGLIDAEKQKASTYFAAAELYNKRAAQLLSKVPAEYQEMAKNGAIAIKDFVGESQGEIADAIEEYRTWSTKAENAENDYFASIAEISAKRLEQLQDIADDFENIVGLTERQSGILQGEMDLLEESGERLSENFYKELMKDSQKQISDLNKKRASLQDILNQSVKSGDVKVGSDDWYEMVNTIYDVDDAILECKKDIEGFQNSINDLYWDNLDKLIDKIDNVDSELSHLYNLVSDEEKVVDEFGNWTKDGVTALGLLAQQLEVANFKVDQYGEAIARLEKDYAAGLYSTDEYNEKLAELKENQWDAIEAQESAKKSIIDLNKTRIQAVKDGMQKEIDAYSELIDKKKEELSLQKEAHDFSKQVAEQQKNIADIEKRLAVIAGDNSASAIAQKKKLQAELAQAKEELDELYYGHSIDKQQEALDKQLEDYQNNKQDEMDALDESLKNENQIIQDSYATVAANTELLAQNLSDIASKYGITLSDSVTKPWLDGANAIGTYQDQLDTSTSSFTDQLKLIKQELVDLQVEADNTANSIINATNRKKDKTESAKYTPPKPSPQKDPPKAPKPKTPSPPSKGSSVTIKKSAKNFSRNGGNGTRMQSWVPGSTFTVYQVSGSEVLIGRSGGYTGWVKLSDIEGYASGAKSINKDQFAFLDELGEELQLVPDGAGRLSYVKKGTGIIPADLTERLMEWGQLDPSSVLEQSRPTVSAPHVINNNIELNMQVGEVVHIDHADNSSIPNITKAVQDQMDNYMKNINKKLYNRVR